MSNTTILVKSKTRNCLRQIGTKGQTYDDIIRDLVKFKKKSDKDSPDREVGSPQSGESKSPLEIASI